MHLAVITAILTKTNPATKSIIASRSTSTTPKTPTTPTTPTITETNPPLINS